MFEIFEFRGLLRLYTSNTGQTSISSDAVPDSPRTYWVAEHIVGRTTAAAGVMALSLAHPTEQDLLLQWDGNAQYIQLNRPVLMDMNSYIGCDRVGASGDMVLSVLGKKLYLKEEISGKRGFWRFL